MSGRPSAPPSALTRASDDSSGKATCRAWLRAVCLSAASAVASRGNTLPRDAACVRTAVATCACKGGARSWRIQRAGRTRSPRTRSEGPSADRVFALSEGTVKTAYPLDLLADGLRDVVLVHIQGTLQAALQVLKSVVGHESARVRETNSSASHGFSAEGLPQRLAQRAVTAIGPAGRRKEEAPRLRSRCTPGGPGVVWKNNVTKGIGSGKGRPEADRAHLTLRSTRWWIVSCIGVPPRRKSPLLRR